MGFYKIRTDPVELTFISFCLASAGALMAWKPHPLRWWIVALLTIPTSVWLSAVIFSRTWSSLRTAIPWIGVAALSVWVLFFQDTEEASQDLDEDSE